VSRSHPFKSARRNTTTAPLRCLPALQCTRTEYPIINATKAICTDMKRRTSQRAFKCPKYCRIAQELFFYSANQFYRPGNMTEYYGPGQVTERYCPGTVTELYRPGKCIGLPKQWPMLVLPFFKLTIYMPIVVNIVMLCLKSCVYHVLVFCNKPRAGTLSIFPGQSRSVTFSGPWNELTFPGH
jgi:hypothetical protein